VKKILFQDSFLSMGTTVSIDVVHRESEERFVQSALYRSRELFELIERRFSRFNSKSELSLLNSNVGKTTSISRQMKDVLLKALCAYTETKGWFDPRIFNYLRSFGYAQTFGSGDMHFQNFCYDDDIFSRPLTEDIHIEKDLLKVYMRVPIDLSGIVKGYAVKKVSEMFRSFEFFDYTIDAGGDMAVFGLNGEGNAWRIAIENIPESKCLFEISNMCVATSGMTRRHWRMQGKHYHHLINPRNPGKFSFQLKTVTVFSSDMIQSDVWAKTFFLMGLDVGLKYANSNSIAAIFLLNDNTFFLSDNAKEYAKT